MNKHAYIYTSICTCTSEKHNVLVYMCILCTCNMCTHVCTYTLYLMQNTGVWVCSDGFICMWQGFQIVLEIETGLRTIWTYDGYCWKWKFVVATQNKGMAVLPDGIIMVSLPYTVIPSLLNLINQSFSFLGMKRVAQSLVTYIIPVII